MEGTPESFIESIDEHEFAAQRAEHAYEEALKRVGFNIDAIGDSQAALEISQGYTDEQITTAERDDAVETIRVSEERLLIAVLEAISSRRNAGVHRHKAAFAREHLLSDFGD